MLSVSEVLSKYGTDKNEPHRYGPVYDRLFPGEARLRVGGVLEIGVAQGFSLMAWLEAFPSARIVGLDVSADHFGRFASEPRVRTVRGDQRVPRHLLAAAGSQKFDLIVDDGSHVINDQLLALFVLWPSLREGGFYVIEEFDMIPGVMDGCDPAHGLAAWRENCAVIRGAEVYSAPNRNGHDEPLLVVRKGQC